MTCSLSEGVVLSGFKQAVVTPLIKRALLSPDDLKSYGPVPGLSFMSKLVKWAVHGQLSEHIHVHNLDNVSQPEYKAGHWTETALISIKNYIHLSLS